MADLVLFRWMPKNGGGIHIAHLDCLRTFQTKYPERTHLVRTFKNAGEASCHLHEGKETIARPFPYERGLRARDAPPIRKYYIN